MSSRARTALGPPQALRARQLRMEGASFRTQKSFGGVLSPVSGKEWKSNPKTARPVAVRQAMHLVLRSSLARNERSMLLHDRTIQRVLRRLAKRFGIRLYDIANSGNHLHLILRLPHRQALTPFLKAATGLIARIVLRVERGHAWTDRPLHRQGHATTPRTGKSSRSRGTEGLASQKNSATQLTSSGPQACSTRQTRAGFWDARPWSRIVSFGPDFKRLKDYLMLNRADLTGFASQSPLGITRTSYRAMLKEVRRLELSGILERLPSFGFGSAQGFG
jgi:REP element-mobilizing transposase RayT